MGRLVKIILLGFVLILTGFFIVYKIYFDVQKIESAKVSSKTEEKLNKLSLEQKIGQLFIIGFDGKSLNSDIENLVKELHPGGILLLKRNIEDENQLKELIISLQEIALKDTGLPLFIAVDQEGGLISRIGWVEKTPQFEIKDNVRAYQVGKDRGTELRELGINLNLAPLLDISFSNDFIFERSFQKNHEIIGELAKLLIQGQKEAGMFTAMKHFPGYGGISFNPEEKLARLENIPEISQFQKAAEVFPEMIMVSNVIYKELYEEYPFSFSKNGIRFLKNNIQGNYLIISDDLSQNSLLNKFSLKEIVTLPIKAGIDVLIFSGWRTPVVNGVSALREAIENGDISEQRINQSVLKIIKLKQQISI